MSCVFRLCSRSLQALLFVIYESAVPHTAMLGRLPGTDVYRRAAVCTCLLLCLQCHVVASCSNMSPRTQT